MLTMLTRRREPMLLHEKMNVDPFAVLNGAAATVCVVDDDPSMLQTQRQMVYVICCAAIQRLRSRTFSPRVLVRQPT